MCVSGLLGRPPTRRASHATRWRRARPRGAARTVRPTRARRISGAAYAARPQSTLSRTISELCIVSEAGSRRCPPPRRRRPPNPRGPAAFLSRWKLQP
ncbi:hypothetical protein EZV77_17310 [Burkholderia thailandensis]|nr:hypothetical protein A8H31_20075 [Burkholderia thailandensis]AVR26894.1 hypothetical protein A8H32_03115 [Burkholderia thailandensis]AWY60232.1 hypothetical protein A8H35_03160 [Burkholderia thailandensis]AWY69536.1 hypothetical protein A8H36_25150 [Burkholderia thailandensis]MDD1481819.1 hypothetical protein [Burkholderia thailandensis]